RLATHDARQLRRRALEQLFRGDRQRGRRECSHQRAAQRSTGITASPVGRIHTLPEALINRIAAGEVVERPASVVKELCENSLDAEANTIRVRLSAGGLSTISVEDDCIGMSREDALACLGRHATSKLRDLDGLFAIATMGFRGEALAAIA